MFVWSKLSSEKWLDAWEERLSGNPALHPVFTTVPGRTTVRIEVYAERKTPLLAVKKEFGGTLREVKNRNWAALSTEPLEPVQVRGRLVVTSARTQKELAADAERFAGKLVLGVPADMAFGTGHHATTATVLRMLADAAAPLKGTRWSMADLGCGSGILAMAAEKFGAVRVWGCDFDAKAVKVARNNAQLNGTRKSKFTVTDILEWEPKETFDIVIANIFYDILEAAFPQIIRSVRPGGVLMVSGILKTQADHCLQVAADLGVKWTRVARRGKWVSALGTAPLISGRVKG